MIKLNYGGDFEESDLIEYINNKLKCNYIIQGQKICNYEDHSKPYSLDFWLRQFAKDHNTMQANNDIMAALVETGLFSESTILVCPTTGRTCKGLVIIE